MTIGKRLDVSLPLVLAIALGITIIIYVFLLPFRNTFLGILLYERGFTQYLVVFMAGIVVSFTAWKFFKLKKEFRALNQLRIVPNIPLDYPNSPEIITLQQRLANSRTLIGVRCGRVLAAYINSGNRKAATDLAVDDSSFYISASESSYAFPKIMVWAIPLLGFIGTVMGISGAVTGFSGFLEQAGEIDQIKEGISTVTSGLAVAFDTTLLALFLSVLVMIPLVLVERFESQLLLRIDIYINDQILPRLNDTSNLDRKAIEGSIKQAIKQYFPNPQDLIEPAHDYAQKAVNSLSQGFLTEVGKVQGMTENLMQEMKQLNQMALKDRQQFITFFNQQQQASQQLVNQIRLTVEEINTNNSAMSSGLKIQTEQIAYQLEKAAQSLEVRVTALEQCTNQITQITRLQKTLEQTFSSLKQTAQLEEVLAAVKENLAQLQPILHGLTKPRRFTLLEQEDKES